MSSIGFPASGKMQRRRFLAITGRAAALTATGAVALPALEANPVGAASSAKIRGLIGEYGFLTSAVLGPRFQEEVRGRVATMARDYGVREFQFYDWFADYSTPVRGARWTDPYFRQTEISRRAIESSIDEVHRQGGRAWAYVQSVGAEEQNLEGLARGIKKLLDGNGKWHWHPPGSDNPRFPTYFPNAAWAEHMVERWAPAIKALGFDGIHWDTLGRIAGNYRQETKGIRAFIQTARKRLEALGLRQTLNMVDLAWWDRTVVRDYLEFPYVETWSPESAARYYAEMDKVDMAGHGGVFAMYPSVCVPPAWTETDVIRARRNEGRKHRLAYLVVGDGARRMKGQYWPETIALTEADNAILRIRNQ